MRTFVNPGLGSADGHEAVDLLAGTAFADRQAAERALKQLLDDLSIQTGMDSYSPVLLLSLSRAADPDQALLSLARFVHASPDRKALSDYLTQHPRAVEVLITLFGASRFLTEILLRRPELMQSLMDLRSNPQAKSPVQIKDEIAESLAPCATVHQQLDALRSYQRGEILWLGMRDLLGLLNMPAVTRQLSHLADGLIDACLHIAAGQTRCDPAGFVVLAMGKLGGSELNYSSDIDLIFLAEREAMNYVRLGEKFIENLSRVTAEGFLYRVDMRLRPWGRSGPLVNTYEAHLRYLERHAYTWERQALIKARPVAGDLVVGETFLYKAEPLIYELEGHDVRTQLREMKQRTEENLRRNGREWGQVKLGAGSIRDIEFVAQYLQLAHGRQYPDIRSRNTLDALRRLLAAGLLSTSDYHICVEGYTFLRTIEHYLQITDYQQTHALPDDIPGVARLAHRLGFEGPPQIAAERFLAHYQQHSTAIRSVYHRYLESEIMPSSSASTPISPSAERGNRASAECARSNDDSCHHLARMDVSYSESFSDSEISRHARLADRLGDDNLVEVEATPREDGSWEVTIVAYDYLGELSIICGLLFAFGFDIISGKVFTYEPIEQPAAVGAHIARRGMRRPRAVIRPLSRDARQKIVDVFTVRSVLGNVSEELWLRYARDLADLLRKLQQNQQREAQGELALRAARTLHNINQAVRPLYPVDIHIDNDASERYTILRIEAQDTIGFLYEFTNALALNGIYIARVTIGSAGDRVQDTLWVTDARGQKITSPAKQRELRAATVLVKHFTHLLPQSPNPEAALLHFGEFLSHLFSRADWPDALASLERPEVLHALARLLGVSEFLWDDFLRMQHENLFPIVRDVDGLAERKTKRQLQHELVEALNQAADEEERRQVINAFKDREMFRIDMRHIQDLIQRFGQFSAELTDLVEVVMETTCEMLYEELCEKYGTPHLEDGKACPWSLCALGKCGGRELGFASDIELMFIYGGNGQTSGPEPISTAEFYEKLVQLMVSAIQARREGIFHIDLQLRPYGKAGSMAVSLDAFRRYFAPEGPAWAYERQALIKLRPIAGDRKLARQISDLRDEFVYGGLSFDINAMQAMRERQTRHLVAAGTINAKYSPGGLVDLEYLIQALQLKYGVQNPALRLTNTREAMTALANAGIIDREDFLRLRDAHRFLRRLIDALRMVRGDAKDLTIPPPDSPEFAYLVRRVRYVNTEAEMREGIERHFAAVREISAKLLR